MKKTKLISTLLLAGVMAFGIGAGIDAGVLEASAADGDLPTETVLAAETLNAGKTNANPWKQMFDYWSNAGAGESNVLYTQSGVVIEGTSRDNSINMIHAPNTVTNGNKLEFVLAVPLYTSAGVKVDGADSYVKKFVLELYQAGKSTPVGAAWFWGDSYSAAKDYVSADFGINVSASGTGQITGIQIPKRFMEEGGGVKLGFDIANGWYCEAGGADAAYQAVVDVSGVEDTKRQAYRSALTAVSDVTEITRVHGTQKWNTDASKTRVCIKELNGQGLCLNAENKLAVSDCFNVSALQVRSNTRFRAGQSYSFSMLANGECNKTIPAQTTKPDDGATVWAYLFKKVYSENIGMGDIPWNPDCGFRMILSKKDGTVASDTKHMGGQAYQLAQFTIPESGEFNLQIIFVTDKGYVTLRNLSIVAEAVPFIQAEDLAKTAYYNGDEITIPSAKLMNKEGTAEITDATVTSSVTFGGNTVAVSDGKFTAENAGKYTIAYSVENDGLTITSTLDVIVKADTVKSIEIATQPAKTAYYAGETFDAAGMVVNAVYESGKKAAITDYIVPATELTAGQTSVQITYGTHKTPVIITVSAAPTVQVTGTPNKVYYTGQEVAVPDANLVDEDNRQISGVTVTSVVTRGQESVTVTGGKFIVSETGEYKIKYSATYGGREYTKEVTFTVQADTVTAIKVTAQPTKTSYTAGEKFDRTGMVVKAVYASLKEVEITDYTVDDKDLELSDTQVTVNYRGFTAKVSVRVHASVYISVEEDLQETYYIGTEVTIPVAKLLNAADGGAEITGVTIDSAVTFGGESVTVTEGKFTVENAGKYTIAYTVVYEGEEHECSLEFTGIVDRVTEIKITAQPAKTTYIEGDTFDASGMAVTGVYESGREAEITDFEYKLVALTTKDNAVVISYGGCSASVTVKVEPIGSTSGIDMPQASGGGCKSAVGAGVCGALIGMTTLACVCIACAIANRKKGHR